MAIGLPLGSIMIVRASLWYFDVQFLLEVKDSSWAASGRKFELNFTRKNIELKATGRIFNLNCKQKSMSCTEIEVNNDSIDPCAHIKK